MSFSTNKARLGIGLLYLWLGFNLLLAAGIVASISALDKVPPAVPMLLSQTQQDGLDPEVTRLIQTMGVILNGAIVSVCLMGLGLVHARKRLGKSWSYRMLWLSLGTLQIMGFLSDRHLDHANLLPNLLSTVLLVGGLLLSTEAGWLPDSGPR